MVYLIKKMENRYDRNDSAGGRDYSTVVAGSEEDGGRGWGNREDRSAGGEAA